MSSRRWLCSLVAGLLLGACTYDDLGAMGQGELRSIELDIKGSPIGWQSNDTIVLFAYLGDKQRRKDGAVEDVGRIATYNYKNGELRAFGKVNAEHCYADGYIHYIFLDKATDELWVSYGELGKEETRKIRPGEMNFDRGTCRLRSEMPKPPDWAQGKYFIRNLRAEDGIINCTTPDFYEQKNNARYHLRHDPIGVELPFSCYKVPRGFRFYPFKGAYFAQEHASVIPWPQGRERRAFWLFPDGKVETMTFPYSTAIRGDMLPTAGGIISFSWPDTREEEYRIHLIRTDGTRELFRGSGGGVVSPNGCRVALLHDEDYTARVRTSGVTKPTKLKLLDFCERR